jgi:hypothetical protein
VAVLPVVHAHLPGLPARRTAGTRAGGFVEGVLSGALAGALAGAVIGTAQWSVLRRYLRVGPEWVLAAALGMAIGDALAGHLKTLPLLTFPTPRP